jgi:hypothetical protein
LTAHPSFLYRLSSFASSENVSNFKEYHMRKIMLSVILTFLVATSACAPKVAEDIKTVEVPVEKIVTVQVEVPVEVVKTVEVIKTVIVTQVVKPTSRPPPATPEAITDVFAYNWLGEIDSKELKVELARVLCGPYASLEKLGTSFDDVEGFENYENACMFIWRITNNASKPVRIPTYDAYALVGTSQANLADYEYSTEFGTEMNDAIMPGAVAVTGFWFPIKNLPELPAKVSLRLDRLIDPDTYRSITGYLTIEVETPAEALFEPLPDELK